MVFWVPYGFRNLLFCLVVLPETWTGMCNSSICKISTIWQVLFHFLRCLVSCSCIRTDVKMGNVGNFLACRL